MSLFTIIILLLTSADEFCAYYHQTLCAKYNNTVVSSK